MLPIILKGKTETQIDQWIGNYVYLENIQEVREMVK
mgnify:CR=1 FL=1